MRNEIREAGHDWLYDRDHTASHFGFMLMMACVLVFALMVLGLCGCADNKSWTREASGFGLLLEPLGSSPNMPRAALGSFAVSGMVKPVDDTQPLLNRIAIEGAFGSQHKVTQAAGPVGAELAKAGDTLPAVVHAEHGESRPLLPFEPPDKPPQ